MASLDRPDRLNRSELENEIEFILTEFIAGDSKRGPSEALLRKANSTLREIMVLVDRYK